MTLTDQGNFLLFAIFYASKTKNKIGRIDDAVCPRCGEEDDTPDHIVFRCMGIKRIKDVKGKGKGRRVNPMSYGRTRAFQAYCKAPCLYRTHSIQFNSMIHEFIRY